jgi:hypothetical protein
MVTLETFSNSQDEDIFKGNSMEPETLRVKVRQRVSVRLMRALASRPPQKCWSEVWQHREVMVPFILKFLLALKHSYFTPSRPLDSLILGLRVCMDPSLHVPLPVWEWLFNGNTV